MEQVMRDNLIRGHLPLGTSGFAKPVSGAVNLNSSSSRFILTHRSDGFRQILVGVDGLALFLSFAISYFVRATLLSEWVGSILPFSQFLWIFWVIAPVWFMSLWFFGFYDSNRYWPYKELLRRLAKAQAVAALGVMSVFYLSKTEDISRLFFQTFVGVSSLLLVCANVALKRLQDHLRRKGFSFNNVVIAGLNNKALSYYEAIRAHPSWGVCVIGFLCTDGDVSRQEFCGKPVLGSITNLLHVLHQRVVDEVILALPRSQNHELEQYVHLCEEMGVTARVILDIPRTLRVCPAIETVGQFPLLSFESTAHNGLAFGMKRLIDILGALVGLGVFSVMYLYYAPKIRRDSPGPVIFRQTRVGKHGRLFILYKFRTMYQDAEKLRQTLTAQNQMNGPIFKIKNDPRITAVGQRLRSSHVDELPQFWNVFRGDMSLVGTRPPTPEEVAQYLPSHHRRLSMKPGLTGLWQLNGNQVSDFAEIVQLDCQYIDEWSLYLDLKILVKTIQKTIRGTGW
jgi:exopolysaccharide biosynthesis polyprenyl glycosylphosphotransferase